MNEDNFYRKPDSPEPETRGRRGSSIKAIVAGLAVDLMGGYALQSILALALAFSASSTLEPTEANVPSHTRGMR